MISTEDRNMDLWLRLKEEIIRTAQYFAELFEKKKLWFKEEEEEEEEEDYEINSVDSDERMERAIDKLMDRFCCRI